MSDMHKGDISIVTIAARVATMAHGDQKYGVHPYTHHLSAVVGCLEDVGVKDEDVLAAAWLHDVVEDTWITEEAVEALTNRRVATLVMACTGQGKNRRERKADLYHKLNTPMYAPGVLVKLADRLSNMANARREQPRLFNMYSKELQEFLAETHSAIEGVWKHVSRSDSDLREKAALLWLLCEGFTVDPDDEG